MTCAICGSPAETDQLLVSTTDGGHAHIACADREACAAFRVRTIRALASGSVGVGGCGLAIGSGIDDGALIVLTVALIVMHVLINRRLWRYLIQGLGVRG